VSGPLALAVAQTVPRGGDVEANLEEHLRMAEAAAKEGARLLLFPELSLTGYELELARELAFTLDDPRLEPLAAAARSRELTLVVGAPALVGERLHIGSLVLAPGRPAELYTKQRLGAFPAWVRPGGRVPPPERTVFEPGQLDPPVQVGGRLGALAVCADVGRPDHVERAAARGASVYLASMFVIPGELADEEARLAGHAKRHAMVVAMANFGGPSGGLDSGGRSAIWSGRGEPLVRLGRSGGGLAVALEGSGAAGGWHTTRWPGAA
jgi:predicted amidohydrolase